jgi:predicted RNA polymerase sigma factor
MAVEGPDRWSAYHQAARFSLDTNERNDESLAWIDQSMALKESFWNYELKARLLHRAGRTAEALPLLSTAMALAEGKAPTEYVNGLAKTHLEWTTAGK